MNESIKKLKKLISNHLDKKILILGTVGFPINEIQYKLGVGELYTAVFDHLLIENFGYIDEKYIADEEKKRIEDTIEIKNGIPLLSHKILDSDIIAFIYVNPKALRVLCLQQGVSYHRALNIQNKLIQDLKEHKCCIVKINLYSYDISFDGVGRNVYICDDQDYYFTKRQDLTDIYNYYDIYFRFPYVKKVDHVNHLKRKQGFLLIINENKLEEKDYINIDKKYRKFFSRFNLVYIITNDVKKLKMFHIKYSNMYFVSDEYFDDDSLMELYYEYLLNHYERKFSDKKLNFFKANACFFKK